MPTFRHTHSHSVTHSLGFQVVLEGSCRCVIIPRPLPLFPFIPFYLRHPGISQNKPPVNKHARHTWTHTNTLVSFPFFVFFLHVRKHFDRTRLSLLHNCVTTMSELNTQRSLSVSQLLCPLVHIHKLCTRLPICLFLFFCLRGTVWAWILDR